MTCSICGKVINAQIRDIATQVVGWNIPRSEGGQNVLWERKETGALAHVMCVKFGRAASPEPSEQETLWSE